LEEQSHGPVLSVNFLIGDRRENNEEARIRSLISCDERSWSPDATAMKKTGSATNLGNLGGKTIDAWRWWFAMPAMPEWSKTATNCRQSKMVGLDEEQKVAAIAGVRN